MNFEALLTSVLEMTVVSSVIVLIVMLMRKTAGRLLPKGFIFALWGVVILKLLVPMSIPSPTSVYNVVDVNKLPLIEAVSTSESVNDIPPMPIVTIPVTDPSAESSPSAPVVGEVIPDSYPNGTQQSTPQQNVQHDVQTAPETLPNTVTQSTDAEASHKKIDTVSVIGTVYCTVTAALMAAGIIAYSITALRISRAETVTDERIRAILDSFHGGKNIAVKSLRKNRSIMIFGIIRPTVVVPEDHNTLNDRELTYLLMHEYQHYRHFDMLWNVLMLAAVYVHWFNPLVYVARRIFLCDMETACDARVLKSLPENEKTDFAETLVSFAQRNSSVFAAPVMGFGKRNVKERVLAVVKYKKTGVIAAILSTAVIITVVGVFATGASIKDTAEAIEEITTDEAIDPEEDTDTAPEQTETEQITTEVQTEGETEPEEAPEIKIERVSTTLASWRTDMTDTIDRLGADSSFELAISDAEDTVLTVKTENGIASVTEVYFKGASYPIEFSDVLERYPITSNLDITYAGGFVSVGLRNYLGTYYVFMEGGYSKLERDESVGYYVWRDGEGLSYMKQNLAFEFVSSGIDTFVSAYKSADQFYMDFGKIVSADGGKLAITQTSWTVQDYFMSDSFVMAAERDTYGYDSVEKFVSDYIAEQLGESDFESEEETDEPAREEPPTEVPDIEYTMKYHISITEKSSNWFKQVFPNDRGIEYSYAKIGDYDYFKSITAGVDSETMDFYKNAADGSSVPVQYTEWRETYDESFFENNIVLAVYINKSNPTDTFSVSGIGFDSKDRLIISIKTDHAEDTPPPICEQRVYFIELERNAVSRAKDIKIKSIGSKYPPTIMNTIWPMDIYIKEDSRYFENNSVNKCVDGPSVICVKSYGELLTFWHDLNSVADGTYANAADDIMTGIFFKKFNEEYFEKYSVCFVYFPSVQIAEEYLLNDSYYSGGNLHIGLTKREPYISGLRDTKQLLVAVGILQNVMAYVDGVSIDVNQVIGPRLRGISVMTRLDYLDEEYLWSFASNQSDKVKAGHYPIVAIDSYQKLVGFLDGAHRKIGADMYVYLTTAYQENYFDEEVLVLTYADEVALNYHAIPVSQYEEYWDGMNSTYKIKYFFEEDDSPYISDYPLSKYAMCHLSLSKREFNDKSFLGFTW